MQLSSRQSLAALLSFFGVADATPHPKARYGERRTRGRRYGGGSRKYTTTPKDITQLAARPVITAGRLRAAHIAWNTRLVR